jgi:eukaryotic-like serine/threonine-protein kinase
MAAERIILRRWAVIRPLTSDGMGEVLLVRDRANGDALAVIKRIHPSLAGEASIVQAFAVETALAMRLVHPNIVKVLESAKKDDDGTPFFVMEWLDGMDLKALLRALLSKRAQMHPAQALVISSRVARALAHAHALTDEHDGGSALGLVHRDVSPHNVFLTKEGVVKLLDFGVAKTRAMATRSGLMVGKPAYMAPEQIDGLHVDARTDLFALGVVLWEMLTGRRLWQADSVDETARMVRENAAPPPSVHAAGISKELDRFVLSLVAKFAAGRPANATSVATTLERFAGEQGSKHPEYEIAHLVKKNHAG